MINSLAESGTLTADSIANQLQLQPRTTKATIRSLKEKGAIVRAGGKKNGCWIVP